MQKKLLTDEQEAYFIAHQAGHYSDEVCEMMNEKFGIHMTRGQVTRQRKRLHVYAGKLLDRFIAAGKSTFFQHGNRPKNKLPVGAETIKSDGYMWRKVAEPNKWRPVHAIVWEAAHGKPKRGERIIFLNKDKLDTRLENLAVVSSNANAYLNNLHLRFTDAELTAAGINVARLALAVKKRKEQKK